MALTKIGNPLAAIRATNSAADEGLLAAYAEIGLTRETVWYASIVLNGIGALTIFSAALIMPSIAPDHLFVAGFPFLAMAVGSSIALKRWRDAEWGLPFRILGSWAAFAALAVAVGDTRIAFIWIPVIALNSTCSIYGARRGIQYSVIAILLIVFCGLTTESPYATAIAAVGATGAALISVALLFVQGYVRSLAMQNRRLATTDELTQIANMRCLREHIAERLAKQADEGEFALFAIDLNQFKRVNDEFDHGMGDRVLQAVAAEMDQATGSDILVARRGGDEFSVLVTDPDERDLEDLRRELAAAIHRARAAVCPEVDPSGSVGFTVSREGDQLATVLRRADDALHEAKQQYRASAGAIAPVTRIHAERVAATHADEIDADDGEPSSRHEIRGLRIVWGLAALLFGVSGLLAIALALSGALGSAAFAEGLALGGCFIVLAGLSILCSARQFPTSWLPAAYVVAVAASTGAAAAAGEAGVVLVNLLPLLAMFAFVLFRGRIAGLFLLASMTSFTALSAIETFANATVGCVCTVFVVLASAGLLSKVRSVTARFIRTNLELSEIDSLTGVANLRALRARIGNVVERADRRAAVIALDLDEFKQVNDVYSHSIGDAVLVATARAVAETARIEDLVARRGGDEFFVIADGACEEQAQMIASRMSEAIELARRRICPDLQPSVSIAVAEMLPGDDTEALMTRADLALHEVKAASHARRSTSYPRLAGA